MIRAVSFRDEIIFGTGALLHTDARDLDVETANVWAQRFNSWVRKGRNFWQWKELQLTEERAFRQVRNDLLNYLTGEEVYDLALAGYYRALAAIAPGESPTTTPAKWQAMFPVDRYIALEQYGKQPIEKIITLHASDPRACRHPRTRRYGMSSFGIDVRACGGNTAWLTYQPMPPLFTGEIYDPLKVYLTGNLVYDPPTGESYRARRGSENQPVDQTLYWHRQRMPYILSDYVQYGVASDLSEDIKTKQIYADEAEDRIIGETRSEVEQGVRNYYSLADQERLGFDYCYFNIPYTLIEVCAA